jgi:hypothetical protein
MPDSAKSHTRNREGSRKCVKAKESEEGKDKNVQNPVLNGPIANPRLVSCSVAQRETWGTKKFGNRLAVQTSKSRE